MRVTAAALLAALLLALSAAPAQQRALEVHKTVAGSLQGPRVAGRPRANSRTLLAADEAEEAPAAIVLNAAGTPLLTPKKMPFEGHDLYYEVPVDAKGLVIILHMCGGSASDFWPASDACPECTGMPESLVKTKQALRRLYAVAALSSFDRSTGAGSRCFSWGTDSAAAVQAVKLLPRLLGLRDDAPVYLNGASSGGSLALRLPSQVEVDGIIAEVIGITDYASQLGTDGMYRRVPPVWYVHMSKDRITVEKVRENYDALRSYGVPVAKVNVLPVSVYSTFFSDRSPLISDSLSRAIYHHLEKLDVFDGEGVVDVDPKNATWAKFQTFLEKELEPLVQQLKAEGQEEQNVPLLVQHIWECVNAAWGRHETIGEYMTAALVWLESGGTADVDELVKAYEIQRPATLQPAANM